MITMCLAVVTLTAIPLSTVYPIDSSEVMLLKLLAIEAGITPLSSAGPYSGHELSAAVAAIDPERLSQDGRALLAMIADRLGGASEDIAFSFDLGLAFEGYVDTHADPSATAYDWFRGYNGRNGFLNLDGQLFFGDAAYGRFAFEAKNTRDYNHPAAGDSWFVKPFATNISFSNGSSMEDLAPFDAYFSVAGTHVSLIGGRSLVSWGRGNTGNLLVDDDLGFHDFMQASAWNRTISYKLLLMTSNLLSPDGKSSLSLSFRDNFRLYTVHRFEWDITDWLRFTLNEGALFYAERLDLRMFNPMMYMHNYHNDGHDLSGGMYDEVNNFVQLELEVAFLPGFSFHAQAFIDQFEELSELQGHDPVNALPNAWGALGGIDMAKSLHGGVLSAYVEAVYTSPYLYLRGNSNDGGFATSGGYNLSLVGAHEARTGSGTGFIGYRYGPDTVLAELGVRYGHTGRYSVAQGLQFAAFGEHGLAAQGKNMNLERGQTAFDLVSPSGIPMYRLVWSLEGSYTIGKTGLSLSCAMDLINIWNHRNVTGVRVTDLQLTFGASYVLPLIR